MRDLTKTLRGLENNLVLHCEERPSQITEPKAGVRQFATLKSPIFLARGARGSSKNCCDANTVGHADDTSNRM